MTMVLLQTKDGWMGIGFDLQNLVFLVMEKRPQKVFHNATLPDRYLPNLKFLQEKVLKKINMSVRVCIYLVYSSFSSKSMKHQV